MAAEHKRSRISDDEDVTRSTKAVCKKCHSVIGSFYNAWIKVTGSYYLPVVRGSYDIGRGLVVKGKEKPASFGTALDGTHIRPLACLKCDEYLAIICTKTPETKASFRTREFFELPRMELRCDSTNSIVQPIVESAPSDHRPTLPVGESRQSAMDVDKPMSEGDHPPAPAHAPPAPSSNHQSPILPPAQAQYQSQKHAYPPIISARRPSPPPSSKSSPYSHPTAPPTVNGYPPSNGVQQSSREHEITLDMILRLQTQVSYNTAGLHTQRRDFEALSLTVAKLSEDINSTLASFRRELQTRPAAPAAPAPPPGTHLDDSTLEVFASNLSSVAAKANEIDGLRMQLEIVKRRIKIVEEGSGSAPSATPIANITPAVAPSLVPFASPHEPPQPPLPTHQMPPPQPIQQYHSHTTPPIPRLGTPGRTESRVDGHPPPQVAPSYHHTTQQEMAHALEAPTAHASQLPPNSGWVSVNPTAKRGPPNGVESPMEGRPEALGSPKRPKLAPLEPRLGQESAAPMSYDHMQTDEREYAVQHPRESNYDQSSSAPSTFIAYNQANEAPTEAYRTPTSADRPRRIGRGSSRGRGRRSMPADGRELGTPEWEKPDWNGAQVGHDGYYNIAATPDSNVARGGDLVRRSSGGGPIAMRPIELARPSSQQSADPYAHTKKTRTKPVRNAEGILIRKDGRPDMRSQSSAANLRKVHARKEQERIAEQRGHTPTSGLANAPLTNSEQQQQQGSATPDPDAAPPSTQERHEQIMRQMFPRGVDDQANRRNFRDQYFPRNSSPVPATKIKPEVHTPSEREDTSEIDSQRDTVNGRSPTTDADRMDVDRSAARPIAQTS